ncbi:hypothetical protein ASF21_12830 [Arthrobacter sp. Leaf234]|uniref:hypothetical protein n=1 Tax=Arthrobacter sp. Leaf234 TaxID=1736303 RepID=UPI0006F7659E|nr:hypothetical protein [Arthrobacter sp. Leaf234]KQN99686.1 hypothetical protein ASF21_12830 [Arthrobacter sp. Leaf234]
MVRIANSFEGGAAGTNVTTGNSGGVAGTACSIVNTGSGNSFAYTGTNPIHGARSALATYGTTAGGQLIWNLAGTVGTRLTSRHYARLATMPTVQEHFGSFYNTANQSVGIPIITASGFFGVQNAVGANIATSSTTGQQATAGTVYRIEHAATAGTTTSNGRIEVAFFEGESTTPLWSYDSGPTVNAGTTAFATYRLGRNTNLAQTRAITLDSYEGTDELTSGFIGPVTSTTRSGSLTGATLTTGTILGRASRKGLATGTTATAGPAAGASATSGAVTTSTLTTGTVAGKAARSAAMSTSTALTSDTRGKTTRVGSVPVTTLTTSTVEGSAPTLDSRSGSVEGSTTTTSTLSGVRRTRGATLSTTTIVGSAQGKRGTAASMVFSTSCSGAIAGHYVSQGSATHETLTLFTVRGTSSAQRDLDITITAGPRRYQVEPGGRGYTVQPGRQRWKVTA